jgi:glutaminase
MRSPNPNPFLPSTKIAALLQSLHERYGGDISGKVADYIPELTKVPADGFGIAIASVDGAGAEVGDAETPFTIQSISKAFTFAMLLDLVGADETFKSVGVQPSGDPFNAITLDPGTNRPLNPMVNAGAIAVAGRLCEVLGQSAFEEVLARLSDAAGRPLAIDEAVFRSEHETGHRNRAIGHFLRAAGVFNVPVDDVLDLYFRQCSILVTARDLAVMAATLANVGANPITSKEVFGVAAVRDTLAVMFTCGMYNASGDWARRVGLPAKSGVGGGVLAVVNRQLGIGIFSPRLDSAGNSVRGLSVCVGLGDEFGLHAFDCTNPGSSILRALSSHK